MICRCEEVSREEILGRHAQGRRDAGRHQAPYPRGDGIYARQKPARSDRGDAPAYYEMPVDQFLPGSIRMPVGAVKLSVLAEALESPGSAANEKRLIRLRGVHPMQPCVSFCPAGAISIADGLTGLPAATFIKCVGCALCDGGMPGQACFVIDEDFARVSPPCISLTNIFRCRRRGIAFRAGTTRGTSCAVGPWRRYPICRLTGQTKVICISVPRERAARSGESESFKKGDGRCKD